MAVYIFDQYYLGITAVITVGYQLLAFLIMLLFGDETVNDFAGGSNFLILALVTLNLGGTYYTRNIIASVLVMVWATRLALFLLIRVIKSSGKDTRFDDKRKQPIKMAGFFIFQILWVWAVSLPVTLLNSPAASVPEQGGGNPPLGTRDIIGIIMWSIGFLCETIADFHKFAWRFSKPPKSQFIRSGLWKFSRAPNYFGEILLWWGIFVIVNSVTVSDVLNNDQIRIALWFSILSPLFTMFLLLGLSGLPLTQKPTGRKFFLMSNRSQDNEDPDCKTAWSRYKSYVEQTSVLIPFPNFIYRKFPEVLRWVFLDFPIYRFNEEKDGPKALQEEEQKQQDNTETRAMV
ncbi:unnamed protein product [Adineta ricciae]|uniref:Steroid 5-alpha reductase C-terminal domain-containing protein n=1 Tax=Adineta ricciae TaxID=249248 RepID=A0A814GP42_ADIRI|nr:unnamed protein product [Adineta ricciae]CAF0998825.1 unnamed protein product [Adineta ricciae]